jgi:hypothetical protein
MTTVTVTRNVLAGIQAGHRFFSLYDDSEAAHQHKVPNASWGARYSTREDCVSSVVVSEVFDQVLLDKLLLKYEIISIAPLRSYLNYLDSLAKNVKELGIKARASNIGPNIKETSIYDYIRDLGRNSSIGGVPAGKGLNRALADQVVYFIGIPQVMLAMWNRYTESSNLDMYITTGEGLQVVNLSDIAEICTRYETLQSEGCLSCDNKHNCPAHLLGEDIPPVEVTLSALKGVIARLNIEALPHSDCVGSSRYGISKIDLRVISMEGAEERNKEAKERRQAIQANTRFYRDNCTTCALTDICGTAKSFTRQGQSASSYCSGKMPDSTILEVNLNNYMEVMEVVMTSILLAANKPIISHVQPALNCIQDWVDSPVNVPRHASYFINALERGRGAVSGNRDYYTVPKQLIDLANLIDLQGSFDGYNDYWYRHGIGAWFSDATMSITSLVPTTYKSGGWFTILDNQKSITAAHTQYYTYQYVDTKVLSKVLGVTLPRKSKLYDSPESRLQLATEFILKFLCPYSRRHYGPFGAKVAWVSEGVPSPWAWNYYRHERTPNSFEKSRSTCNVIEIFSRLRNREDTLYQLKNNNRIKDVMLNG